MTPLPFFLWLFSTLFSVSLSTTQVLVLHERGPCSSLSACFLAYIFQDSWSTLVLFLHVTSLPIFVMVNPETSSSTHLGGSSGHDPTLGAALSIIGRPQRHGGVLMRRAICDATAATSASPLHCARHEAVPFWHLSFNKWRSAMMISHSRNEQATASPLRPTPSLARCATDGSSLLRVTCWNSNVKTAPPRVLQTSFCFRRRSL